MCEAQRMYDAGSAEVVEVDWAKDKNGTFKLWINVDGKCVCRVYRIKDLLINPITSERAAPTS